MSKSPQGVKNVAKCQMEKSLKLKHILLAQSAKKANQRKARQGSMPGLSWRVPGPTQAAWGVGACRPPCLRGLRVSAQQNEEGEGRLLRQILDILSPAECCLPIDP